MLHLHSLWAELSRGLSFVKSQVRQSTGLLWETSLGLSGVGMLGLEGHTERGWGPDGTKTMSEDQD